MGRRLNIGLLVDDLDAVFTKEACKGAEQGAIDADANIFIFPGGYLDASDEFDAHAKYGYQYNSLFSFVNKKHIDILYVTMGMIGCRVDFAERIRFLKRFEGIPIVSLYNRIEGYHSVTFNNRVGFYHAISHLVKEHGVERIGFVSGPATNTDAQERLSVYQEVLREYQIPYREEYVVYGNFEETSEGVAGELVEKHPELQAVVFANDRMAFGGYQAYKKMGLEIGSDILIVSFDNSSFAATMTPPLTTVEANAAELAYYAVLHAEQFIKTGTMDDLQIDTHFICRASCGCIQFNRKHVDQMEDLQNIIVDGEIQTEIIHTYLFGSYLQSEEIMTLKDDFAVLCRMMLDMVKKVSFDAYVKDCEILFSQLLENQLLHYTTVEQLFNLLSALQSIFSKMLYTDAERLKLSDLFSLIYRNLAVKNFQFIQGQQARMEQVSQTINHMCNDIFTMENLEEISYASALANLSDIGFKSAFLYLFQKPVVHTRENVFEHPARILCKAYSDGTTVCDVPTSRQLMKVERIMLQDAIPDDRRLTMVLSPLFSGSELYGLLLSEVNYDNFKNIAPITLQFSIAMKSLALIEQQRKAQQKLEISLDKIKENNTWLDGISKSDELTGLYNRRGFLENVKNVLNNKRNIGKRALLVYADMDNLKMINDNYGHDEGDFALKEIASILKDAFRTNDIIGRFGGDEFVVFALVGIEKYSNIMKRRITEVAIRHNDCCNKPYPIELSSGICEFECSPEADIYALLDVADTELYKEKAEKKAARAAYR